MKKEILAFASTIAACSAMAFTVTDVSARQRYPWNNLVDVDFTIGDTAATDTFRIEVKAAYAGGDRELEARTFLTDPVVKAGRGRVTWAIEEDYPNLKAEDVKVAVTVVPFTSLTPVYMVIDLSEGSTAKSYDVRYTTKDPVHTPKANDACKTTQLWLRRIKATGVPFVFRSTTTPKENNNTFYVKLTKDYYIGIFETTQQQWYQMSGKWVGEMSNETWRATRPLDNYSPALLYTADDFLWPDVKEPIASSLLKKLRNRTGLATLNLPTEAQWQFAAVAGATRSIDRYLDPNGNQYNLADIARYYANATNESYSTGLCDADSGTACVGTYKPNAFGLYDVIGNVNEDCLDPYVLLSAGLRQYYIDNGYIKDYTEAVVDPEGIPIAAAKKLHSDGKHRAVTRGGRYKDKNPSLWTIDNGFLNYAGDAKPCTRGFRFCVTCE